MSFKRGRPPKIIFLFFAIIAVLALGGIVMLLWNAILPDLLNTKRISYWQAVGLFLLSKLLFSSFKPGGPRGRKCGPNEKLREKFETMTPEERLQFRKQWRDRFKGDWRNRCAPPEEETE